MKWSGGSWLADPVGVDVKLQKRLPLTPTDCSRVVTVKCCGCRAVCCCTAAPPLALCLTPNQKTPLGTLGIPPFLPSLLPHTPNIKQQERQTDLHNKGLKCFDVSKRAIFVVVFFSFESFFYCRCNGTGWVLARMLMEEEGGSGSTLTKKQNKITLWSPTVLRSLLKCPLKCWKNKWNTAMLLLTFDPHNYLIT